MLLLVAGCLIGGLFLAGLGLVIFLIMQAGAQDTVSTARQDWIERRSEQDQREW